MSFSTKTKYLLQFNPLNENLFALNITGETNTEDKSRLQQKLLSKKNRIYKIENSKNNNSINILTSHCASKIIKSLTWSPIEETKNDIILGHNDGINTYLLR